jgi:5S rRNA maturation endonuclease (ribonuclease M5)
MEKTALLDLLEDKKHIAVICEGKRDVVALKHFGFTHITMLEGHALYQVVEMFDKGSTVQILTDLDSEGKKLFSKLRADLSQRGVRIDNELREVLFKTQLRQIEGLVTYLEN